MGTNKRRRAADRKGLAKLLQGKGLISTEAAAERAYVSTETIRDWIKTKRLEATSYGHRWWVSESSLAKLTEVLR